MGRLWNPGYGELLDRLSILELKLAHAKAQAVDHFTDERDQIALKIGPAQLDAFAFDTDAVALVDVNRALWQYEDALRQQRARGPVPPADEIYALRAVRSIAFTIQELNDRRATLIRKINEACGQDVGPEKL